MKTPLVGDVMTTDVVTARSFTPFRELTATMLARGIGAVPVVDSIGHTIGIVSRSDLLAKHTVPDSGQAEAWDRLSPRGRKVRIRREAAAAGRLMTANPITVTAQAGVARAAYLMQRHAITHLPVLDERGAVIGIVSRGDLLRVFLRDDAEIREDVIRDVLIDGLDADRHTIEVTVDGGVVTLSGTLDSASSAEYAVRMSRRVPGAVDVVDNLHSRADQPRPAGIGPLF
jgi:CBS domain-containing protein